MKNSIATRQHSNEGRLQVNTLAIDDIDKLWHFWTTKRTQFFYQVDFQDTKEMTRSNYHQELQKE